MNDHASHQASVATYLQDFTHARATEQAIGLRAAALVDELLAYAAELRQVMKLSTKPHERKVAQAEYLQCMADLSDARRVRNLARATEDRIGTYPDCRGVQRPTYGRRQPR